MEGKYTVETCMMKIERDHPGVSGETMLKVKETLEKYVAQAKKEGKEVRRDDGPNTLVFHKDGSFTHGKMLITF